MARTKLLKSGIRKPKFKRRNFQIKRLDDVWRKPRGIHNKLRLQKKCKGPKVRIGYKQSEKIRNIHPCGLKEYFIQNLADLEKINPKELCGRLSGKIGTKKKILILEKAKLLGIKIVNPRLRKKKEKTEKKIEKVKNAEKGKKHGSK